MTTLSTTPITTIHPAITVRMSGIPGIGNLPFTIPEPTANETKILTTQVITLISEFFVTLLPPFLFFSFRSIVEKDHRYYE